ncbi:MAG: flagellar basal body P-ring protein FlgI [Deltaproteobacteria bacterium]|nr:flagellar basal body P-ring protein FlgI [Deltaproteobacteria bacterium]
MSGRFSVLLLILIIQVFLIAPSAQGVRVKDITTIKGIRPNQLFGYGLVIGLNGTGDKGGSKATIQSLANMLERMGIQVRADDLKANNVAAVMVSASLPAFARIGKKIDVTLSSVGDAKSLQGGTLLLTPLLGVDGKVYALAQGPVSIGGFSAGGAAGGGITKNHPTVARISGGATVEREVHFSLEGRNELTLILNNPDFVTASRVADVINSGLRGVLARPMDSGTIKITVSEAYRKKLVEVIAKLGRLEVVPDSVAKVIISERTGTVVIGENVSISTVAVAHGNLTIKVKETKNVSQPRPFAPEQPVEGPSPQQMEGGVIVSPGGNTVVTSETAVDIQEEKGGLQVIPKGSTIGELVRALNAIGVTPRDLITILQAMKTAGALQAELEIL